MTTQTEALKLALEALEMVKANADDWQERTGKEIKGWMQPVNNSITAIKEALAQPEQEPVSEDEIAVWATRHDIKGVPTDLRCMFEDAQTLSTTPPQCKPLTDEEFISMVDSTGLVIDPDLAFEIKEMVEAAHGIKENT